MTSIVLSFILETTFSTFSAVLLYKTSPKSFKPATLGPKHGSYASLCGSWSISLATFLSENYSQDIENAADDLNNRKRSLFECPPYLLLLICKKP